VKVADQQRRYAVGHNVSTSGRTLDGGSEVRRTPSLFYGFRLLIRRPHEADLSV
jgi:hypothetical protein